MGTILLHGHVVRVAATIAILGALHARHAAAQTITLEDALRQADAAAWANRIGDARATERGSDATAALRGVLPTVRVEAGFVRTTDPIGAFGTALRQRSVTATDFDPVRLNDPGAIGNYAGALVVEQPVFNADAHLGRRAAKQASRAAEAGVMWTRYETRLEVIRAYYGAVLAWEMVRTLEAAHVAALAHVEQARVLVQAGMATRSDALLAEVKAGEVEVQLIEARDREGLARRQLAVVLALPGGASPSVSDVLPSIDSTRRLLTHSRPVAEPTTRADVQSARLGAAAARTDAWRATSLHLPRVNAFARYDWNSARRLYGGDESWTIGLMATWTVFSGASTIAERRAANARLEVATLAVEATEASAALEFEAAASARRVALARLDIAERAVAQSEAAHRIVSRKYDGGLATVLEMLDAAAVETRAKLSLADARYSGVVAAAEELRVAGHDPAKIIDWMKPELLGIEQ